MDDGRLRAVLTAVDRGSFSKAAAELGYTQSAMTHLVNNLEAELGCTLLNRGSHGVRLSEEGEQLLPYIKNVIDACDALRQEAASQSRTQSHQLSLGCFASIARAELPTILQEFKEAYPVAYAANVKMPPMGHYGDPELEIGRVCVQLASPDFKYMSGETLTLEGGMGLRP